MRNIFGLLFPILLLSIGFVSCSKEDEDIVTGDGDLLPNLVIDGVLWATTNVDAFGRFADSPASYGKFYLYNYSVAWPVAEVDNWPSIPTGSWQPANNPCPAGWRLPTLDEYAKLLEKSPLHSGVPGIPKVEKLGSLQVPGRWFGPNAEKATLAFPGQAIFLPAVGYNGMKGLDGVGEYGLYWTQDYDAASSSRCGLLEFGLEVENRAVLKYVTQHVGATIRCVKDVIVAGTSK